MFIFDNREGGSTDEIYEVNLFDVVHLKIIKEDSRCFVSFKGIFKKKKIIFALSNNWLNQDWDPWDGEVHKVDYCRLNYIHY